MKKFAILLLFLFVKGFSQGVLPPHRYTIQQQPLLDAAPSTTTFAYSLRKLKSTYTGYAVRITNNNDYSTADVSFDQNGLVSNESNVRVAYNGGSSFSAGQSMPLSDFVNGSMLSVEVWYNQNDTGFDAVQGDVIFQPILQLTTDPASLPTLLFYGYNWYDGKFLVVQGRINEICPGGLGSFLMVTMPTANLEQSSFGMVDGVNWRWSFHLNWSDGKLYFDGAEYCCQNNRSVDNDENLYQWKQYSFVRDNYAKSIRINTNERLINTASVGATPSYYNDFGFGIGTYLQNGYANQGSSYQGQLSEVIMFNRALSSQELVSMEYNQMKYWKIN